MKFDRIPHVLFSHGLTGVLLLMNSISAQAQTAGGPPGNPPAMKLNTSKYSARSPLGDSEKHPVESRVQASGRAAMERRLGGPDWPGYFGRIEDPGSLVNGKAESTAVVIIDTIGGEAIPTNSLCVIIGEVTDAATFLSPDRTLMRPGRDSLSILSNGSARFTSKQSPPLLSRSFRHL